MTVTIRDLLPTFLEFWDRDRSWEKYRWSTERAMDEVRNHLSGNAPDHLEVPA